MSLGTKYSEKGADILVELQVDKKIYINGPNGAYG